MRKCIPAIWMFLMVSLVARAQAPRALHVIPQPKNVIWRTGNFTWDRSAYILLSNPKDETQSFAAELVREEVRNDLGIELKIRAKPLAAGKPIVLGLPSADALALRFAKQHGVAATDLMIPEGYVLSVGNGSILLAGTDADGLFWAAQTLKLIVRTDRDGAAIPALRIDDYPIFHFRGITDDVSRGPVPNMQTIEQNLRRLSELKMNKYNFYIEHTFCYKSHPDIGPEGGCLSAEQIRHISAYARKYHIELVGGLQSFGHWEHILDKPKYMKLAETPMRPEVLCPAKEGTYKLLSELYDEIAVAYDSKLFNISCDETWGLGTGGSRKMLQEMGIEGVYAYHINRVHDLLAAHGKRIMMWADIALQHPGIIDKLPRDIIFLPWSYGAASSYENMLKPLVAARHDFIIAPGVSCWGRIFPDIGNATRNIRQFALDGARYDALGMLNTTWDDDGENLFAYNWYPAAFGAEASWNPFTADPQGFADRFTRTFYGTPDGKLAEAFSIIENAFGALDVEGFRDNAFLSWPAAYMANHRGLARLDSKKNVADMKRVQRIIAEVRPTVRDNTDNIEFLSFAVNRMKDASEHKLLYIRSAERYDAALKNIQDKDAVLKNLDDIDANMAAVQDNVKSTLVEFRRLWMIENRPYYFNVNETKYNDFIKRIGQSRAALAAARETYMKDGTLPKAKDAGL